MKNKILFLMVSVVLFPIQPIIAMNPEREDLSTNLHVNLHLDGSFEEENKLRPVTADREPRVNVVKKPPPKLPELSFSDTAITTSLETKEEGSPKTSARERKQSKIRLEGRRNSSGSPRIRKISDSPSSVLSPRDELIFRLKEQLEEQESVGREGTRAPSRQRKNSQESSGYIDSPVREEATPPPRTRKSQLNDAAQITYKSSASFLEENRDSPGN